MSNKITLDICGITAEEATLDAGLFLSLREERALADRLAEALAGCVTLLREAGFVPGLTGENAVSDHVRAPVQAGEEALAAHAERRKP